MIWWSTFTIATAAAFNYASLLAVRFLFGVGEAGAFPNVSRTFSRWFPASERGTAQGIFFAGAHLGGGLTPILVGVLLNVLNWRSIFVTLRDGRLRLGRAPGSAGSATSPPIIPMSARPSGNTSNRAGSRSGLIELDAVTLGRILSDRNVILLCLMYFTQAYGFYFNITWLPTYLKEARGFSGLQLGVLAGLPLILSALADLTGGLATDRLARAAGLEGRAAAGSARRRCRSRELR